MTNPSFKEIKIGYAENVEERARTLNTGVPSNYDIYATYEVKHKLVDKTLHNLIDDLNPNLRFNAKKEFYSCTPQKAYKLLYQIASISGTLDCLSDEDLSNSSNTRKTKTKEKKEKFSFEKAHIPVGSVINLKNNKNITAIVKENNKVSYDGKLTSLSDLAWKFSNRKYMPQGPLFFEFEGETLHDRRNRLEAEGNYK